MGSTMRLRARNLDVTSAAGAGTIEPRAQGKIYVVVQGMYLLADSIAYDAAFQYRALRALGCDVEVFVERFDAGNYPDVPARPIRDLAPSMRREPGTLLYHWVDGWHEIDAIVRDTTHPTIVRWHNNTPPWFFAPYSPIPTFKTVRGFLDLLDLAEASPRTRFWVNSEFSRRQLSILDLPEERVDVVHPASEYLEHHEPEESASATPPAREEILLLFVGRVVPHKGHRHVLAAAHALQRRAGRPVRAVFPGRPDGDMPGWIAEIRSLAARLGVAVELPGEVTRPELRDLYHGADVFVGLSEHEGFGLPILEAMMRQIPVVGYRNTASEEILADHPLACDSLDPIEVARRIHVAIADPAVRRAVLEWQNEVVVPRFSRTVIEDQLRAALAASGRERVAASAPPRAVAPRTAPREAIDAALRREAEQTYEPSPAAARLHADLKNRFVTRHDLAAYHALLGAAGNGSLRSRALGLTFESHRPVLGFLASLAKKANLRLQDGLVQTLDISNSRLEHRIARLEEKIDRLAAEALRKPASGEPPPARDARKAPTLRSAGQER